jgi:hypothetical protein
MSILIFAGAIFHEDNYNSEIAFKYAVERVNLHEKNFEFVPIVHRVSRLDSYKTERIGEAFNGLLKARFNKD